MIKAFAAGGMLLAALFAVAGRNAAPVGHAVECMIQVAGADASAYGAREVHTVRITLLEVLRGKSAWERILAADESAQPPESGFEYLIARVKVEYDPGGAEGTLAYSVKPDDFKAYSGDDRKYAPLPIKSPKPELIGRTFYPGDLHEGWLCFKVAATDRKPLLFFYGGLWFNLER